MMEPRYAGMGCAAESQELGDAARPVYAWYVNSNNGNANYNNRNNDGLALPVSPLASSPGEYQGAERVTRQQLYHAWQSARRGKTPSCNKQRWEADWYARVCELEAEINAGNWRPRPTTCFVADLPKAREIHAPDFGDRVVHHLLVPRLEAIYESIFVHDSYANRKGKGTHTAVQRLQAYTRQVPRGWYLQLDVANFFNSIPRVVLWRLLKRRMQRADVPMVYQRITHALLRHSPLDAGVVYRCSAAERERVPRHKRLECAPAGRGIPIGNLSSQFFANVLLNELDQFVKHRLRVKRYLRYVDDFVLVHEDRAQLEIWRAEIEDFLCTQLQLELKADQKLQPVADGIDFLGYIVRPTYTLVRRRVVSHARARFSAWQRAHVRAGQIDATPAQINAGASQVASYFGHMRHANARRLQDDFRRRYPWIDSLAVKRRFSARHADRRIRISLLSHAKVSSRA